MEYKAQQLEEENAELKFVNLQYQKTIRDVTGRHKKTANENEQLRDENQELTERLNHLNEEMLYLVQSRANQNPMANGRAHPNAASPAAADATAAKEAMEDKLKHLEKKAERYRGMYLTWKGEFGKMEQAKLELEKRYSEMQDPRYCSEKDRRIKELTRINLELQERLHEREVEQSVDLARIKPERSDPAFDEDLADVKPGSPKYFFDQDPSNDPI